MKMQFIFYIAVFAILQSCNNGQNSTKERNPILLSDVHNKASCVFLTKDEKSNPVGSWTEIDSAGNKHFYFASWDAKFEKFASGIEIPIPPNTSIHEEGMPKIAFKGDGTMMAIYETSVPSEKSRFGLSDIQYMMSFDKGKSWTTPKSIQSEDTHIGSRSFSNIIRLDDGEIGVSWLDTDPDSTNIGRPVKFARTNANKGFGHAILIESSACQCCRTALSSDGGGSVIVVFRNLLSGSVRDISVSNSSDNGRTFNKAVPFSNDHWVVDGCPHNGPSVVSKDEHTYVTWFTGSEQNGVFYAALDKGNNMILKRQLAPKGRFVQLCLMPDGTRIATFNVSYNEGDSTYSKIKLNKTKGADFFEKEITLPRVHASHPVIISNGKHHVIVAWTDTDQIYYLQLAANGISDLVKETENEPFKMENKIEIPKLSFSNDPVCGMKINEHTAVDTTLFQGKVIGFCSKSCKDMFLKDPKAVALH